MVITAPLAVFFIRVINHETGINDVSYEVVATSVAVFLGIPLAAAIVTRFTLRMAAGPEWYERVFLRFAAPWSLIGLLYTILVLFASQGRQVVHQSSRSSASLPRSWFTLFPYSSLHFLSLIGWASVIPSLSRKALPLQVITSNWLLPLQLLPLGPIAIKHSQRLLDHLLKCPFYSAWYISCDGHGKDGRGTYNSHSYLVA